MNIIYFSNNSLMEDLKQFILDNQNNVKTEIQNNIYSPFVSIISGKYPYNTGTNVVNSSNEDDINNNIQQTTTQLDYKYNYVRKFLFDVIDEEEQQSFTGMTEYLTIYYQLKYNELEENYIYINNKLNSYNAKDYEGMSIQDEFTLYSDEVKYYENQLISVNNNYFITEITILNIFSMEEHNLISNSKKKLGNYLKKKWSDNSNQNNHDGFQTYIDYLVNIIIIVNKYLININNINCIDTLNSIVNKEINVDTGLQLFIGDFNLYFGISQLSYTSLKSIDIIGTFIKLLLLFIVYIAKTTVTRNNKECENIKFNDYEDINLSDFTSFYNTIKVLYLKKNKDLYFGYKMCLFNYYMTIYLNRIIYNSNTSFNYTFGELLSNIDKNEILKIKSHYNQLITSNFIIE